MLIQQLGNIFTDPITGRGRSGQGGKPGEEQPQERGAATAAAKAAPKGGPPQPLSAAEQEKLDKLRGTLYSRNSII